MDSNFLDIIMTKIAISYNNNNKNVCFPRLKTVVKTTQYIIIVIVNDFVKT